MHTSARVAVILFLLVLIVPPRIGRAQSSTGADEIIQRLDRIQKQLDSILNKLEQLNKRVDRLEKDAIKSSSTTSAQESGAAPNSTPAQPEPRKQGLPALLRIEEEDWLKRDAPIIEFIHDFERHYMSPGLQIHSPNRHDTGLYLNW